MKKPAIIVVLLAGCLVAGSLLAQSFTYVGSAKCQICHKTENQGQQFPIWQNSEHATSFQDLSSPEAQKLAEALTSLRVRTSAALEKTVESELVALVAATVG